VSVAEMMISTSDTIFSSAEMSASMSETEVRVSEMIISDPYTEVRRSEMIIPEPQTEVPVSPMIISECVTMDSGLERIISAFEMIISVTNTMVKIACQNNFSILNRLSVVVDHGLCDANDHFVDEEDG